MQCSSCRGLWNQSYSHSQVNVWCGSDHVHYPLLILGISLNTMYHLTASDFFCRMVSPVLAFRGGGASWTKVMHDYASSNSVWKCQHRVHFGVSPETEMLDVLNSCLSGMWRHTEQHRKWQNICRSQNHDDTDWDSVDTGATRTFTFQWTSTQRHPKLFTYRVRKQIWALKIP